MTEELDPDLEAFAERVDRAFAATTPPPGFESTLWRRLQQRRRGWPAIDLTQLAGIAAALVVVVGVGFLLTHLGHPGGGAATSSYSGTAANGTAPRAQSGAHADTQAPVPVQAWGALPRPQVAPGPAGPAAGSVTATLTLPPSAIVQRYAEPSATEADGFASGVNAHRSAAAAGASSLGIYSGAGFSLSIFPTNAPQGIEPSFVLTPQGGEPNGSGPAAAAAQDAAQRFLAQFNLVPPASNRLDVAVMPNTPTVVRYVVQVQGHDLVSTGGTPIGLSVVVKADGSVFQANGPLPLSFSPSTYPLAPFADLARLAAGATSATLDHAALVYVLAFDGRFGYLEPAVLFTGSGRSVLVPALAPAQLK